MATIITYTGAKIQKIIDDTVVDGNVDANKHLILEKRNGTIIDGGLIDSPKGMPGSERALPAGQIELFAGVNPPVGWTWCDGSEQSRTTYAELFAAIGTKYGAGDGVTTFNLPNMGGRVAVGMDSTQTEFNDLGVLGGEKAHTLTVNEMPSHKHTILGYAGADDKNFTGNNGRLQASDTTTAYNKETAAKGGGQPHNNMQPYITLSHIISTGKASGSQGGGTAIERTFIATQRGTTAKRDTLFGTPSTVAEQVALANQKVVWFNTDLGWDESYYAVSGSSGLTALGLINTAPAGWYPVGEGPYMVLEAKTENDVLVNTVIGMWSLLRQKGGSSWFTIGGTNNDRINVLKLGRYDVSVFTNQTGGNNECPDYVLQILDSNNAFINGVSGGAFPKSTAFMTRPHQELFDIVIVPNSSISYKLQPGTLTTTTQRVHGGDQYALRGRMLVKYVGPPLASE